LSEVDNAVEDYRDIWSNLIKGLFARVNRLDLVSVEINGQPNGKVFSEDEVSAYIMNQGAHTLIRSRVKADHVPGSRLGGRPTLQRYVREEFDRIYAERFSKDGGGKFSGMSRQQVATQLHDWAYKNVPNFNCNSDTVVKWVGEWTSELAGGK
jgi:hypothetical protein